MYSVLTYKPCRKQAIRNRNKKFMVFLYEITMTAFGCKISKNTMLVNVFDNIHKSNVIIMFCYGLYCLQGDHVCTQPFYPHTLPFGVSLGDLHWESKQNKCGKDKRKNTTSVIVNSQGMSGTYMASTAHHLALQQAKEDILNQLLSR